MNNNTNNPFIFNHLGMNIKFPFKPYIIQENFMRQMIRALDKGFNALLESPTGTGKTLSILCSSLAWLNKHIYEKKKNIQKNDIELNDSIDSNFPVIQSQNDEEKEQMPRIFFSSRTHSQLSQSINEMKKINYDDNYGVILAGRDLLCINKTVRESGNTTAINNACKFSIGGSSGKHKCSYFNGLHNYVHDSTAFKEQKILDIEDLKLLGQKNNFCPYYASKVLEKKCNVVFLPYNYLLDAKIRKSQKINFNDDIVIFDEAHNVESTCENSMSIDLNENCVLNCCNGFENLSNLYTNTTNSIHNGFNSIELNSIKVILLNFKEEIDKIAQGIDCKKTNGLAIKDFDFFSILSDVDLKVGKMQELVNLIQTTLTILNNLLYFNNEYGGENYSKNKKKEILDFLESLSNFKDFLELIISNTNKEEIEFYDKFRKNFRIYLEIVECTTLSSNLKVGKNDIRKYLKLDMNNNLDKNETINKQWILHFWCLTPSLALNKLREEKIRSIIFASGTLAPLDSFSNEFNTEFIIKLNSQHIIRKSQMVIYNVSESEYGSTKLNFSFDNRNKVSIYLALGQTIIDICSTVPDGLLLFFSSFNLMEITIKHWKENGIYQRIDTIKTIFTDTVQRDQFNKNIENFKKEIDDNTKTGAIFFSVCRGKISEGIDLSHKYSRGVIIVGLPYPSMVDAKVMLKKEFLEQRKNNNYTFDDWYFLQMMRPLNQAIGRAIRHKDDYGCVFLIDSRFEQLLYSKYNNCLSIWCRKSLKDKVGNNDMLEQVRNFFETNKEVVVEISPLKKLNLNVTNDINILDFDLNINLRSNKRVNENETCAQIVKKFKRNQTLNSNIITSTVDNDDIIYWSELDDE